MFELYGNVGLLSKMNEIFNGNKLSLQVSRLLSLN